MASLSNVRVGVDSFYQSLVRQRRITLIDTSPKNICQADGSNFTPDGSLRQSKEMSALQITLYIYISDIAKPVL